MLLRNVFLTFLMQNSDW